MECQFTGKRVMMTLGWNLSVEVLACGGTLSRPKRKGQVVFVTHTVA